MNTSRVAVAAALMAVLGGALLVGAGSGRTETTKIATVDMVELLQDMLQTPGYVEAREANRDRSVAELAEIEDEMRRIESELRLLTAADQARGQRLYNDLQQRQQVYRDLAQRRTAEFQALSGQQAAEVYAKIHAAAAQIGREAGYTHVVATRDSATIDEADSIAAVVQGVLARPAILFPSADDLTGRVRAQLSIPVRSARGAIEPGDGAGDEPDQP